MHMYMYTPPMYEYMYTACKICSVPSLLVYCKCTDLIDTSSQDKIVKFMVTFAILKLVKRYMSRVSQSKDEIP